MKERQLRSFLDCTANGAFQPMEQLQIPLRLVDVVGLDNFCAKNDDCNDWEEPDEAETQSVHGTLR